MKMYLRWCRYIGSRLFLILSSFVCLYLLMEMFIVTENGAKKLPLEVSGHQTHEVSGYQTHEVLTKENEFIKISEKRFDDSKLKLSENNFGNTSNNLNLSDDVNLSTNNSMNAVNSKTKSGKESETNFKNLKKILFWNEFYGFMDFSWGLGRKPFIDNNCKVNTCYGINKRNELPMDKYDAILFHVQSLGYFDWPYKRSPHQRYVFVTRESAQYMAIPLVMYNGLFNWTMTYRLDSDLPYLYGKITKSSNRSVNLKDNYASGKDRLVAWFVSNCETRSQREVYVRKLTEHIPIHIYGRCGKLHCPRSENRTCHSTLLPRYKFYLSFENSICKSYVTEKFYEILRYDVVPVVLGGTDYSEIAPPHSYINALEYTPKQLADYLLMLDKNDTLYNEYFKWKGSYSIDTDDPSDTMKVQVFKRKAFCDLCEKLHTNDVFVYKNIYKWWTKDQCKLLKQFNVIPR